MHERVHFILFNLYISGGVILGLRTILHMNMIPEAQVLIIDKLLAILCFFFYWSDICEIYSTSLKYLNVPNTAKEAKDKEEREKRQNQALK